MEVLKGNIIFSKKIGTLEIFENSYIVVNNGLVVDVVKELPKEYSDCNIVDYGDNIIIPGFVDLHFHASQFENLGLGLDYELIPWLNKFTFPEEAKFSDINYAKKVYSKVIKEVWKQGTTRICFFSTIHSESATILMDLLHKSGLGGFVGKVNMDINSAEDLTEDTSKSIEDSKIFIKDNLDKYDLVKPIVTPRFVPSCSSELMENLGFLSKKYNVAIQTHLSENKSEIEWVKELHPESKNYLSVYDKFGLTGEKSIFAHCVYNTDEELDMLKNTGSYVAHCPNANYNLSSGISPIRKYIDKGINVGLGTDVGAGHSPSIKDVMVAVIQGSKIKSINTNNDILPVNMKEVFYLATKGGGSFFGKVGSFEKGFDFDALIIDDEKLNLSPKNLEERLEKFIYCGDSSNIKERYVKGKVVKEPKF